MTMSMTVLPFLYSYEFPHPPRPNHHKLLDQDFGLVLTSDDILTPSPTLSSSEYYFRPWIHLPRPSKTLGSCVRVDKDKFIISLNVRHFKPEEISVKTADGYVIVECKHEQKEDDHGYISRQLTRRYRMPEGSPPENVESRLSSDGVLTITVPKKADRTKDERVVPITQTGILHKEFKAQNEGKDEKKKKTPR